jgi:PAS domain S-box-containing protein
VTRGEGGLLRRLFELAPDGMMVTRLRDGRIVMANDAAARIIGRDRGDLIAQTTEEIGLWPNADRETFVKQIREEERHEPREVRLDTPTGTRWVLVYDELLTLGGRAHVIATLHDITDRMLAEQTVRAERDHYRALVATLQDAYYVVAQDGTMIDVNDRFCDLVGYGREEALASRTPGPWWPSELYGEIMRARGLVVEKGYAEFDWPIVRRDGGRVAGHVTSAIMHDADGSVGGIVVTIRVR